jgi:hypothetical protein
MPFSLRARSVTTKQVVRARFTHSKVTGGKDDERPTISSEWRSDALCDLLRKVWSHPVPRRANFNLFEEVP